MLFHLCQYARICRGVEVLIRLISLFLFENGFISGLRHACFVRLDRPVREKADSKNMALIAEACLHISEKCTEPMTPDDVSRHIGMSKSHFSHLFKMYTGMTFVEFLTAERIKRAEAYFSDPNIHIVDVAYDSGFSSISSFNRAFRRSKGCSPTQFRRTRVD